ncbi:MAG TPA: hypothetical protein VF648_01030 [Pyrinomonadaceae bacterium]
MLRLLFIFAFIFAVQTIEIGAQPPQKPAPQTQTSVTAPIKTIGRKLDVKTSPAYAELVMKRTEVAADLEVLLPDYTEESPEVREKRLSLQILDAALKRLETVTLEQYLALTPAVGKMLARKLEAEAELKILSEIYTDDHPAVKKSKIRFKVFDAELKRLLLQTNSQ